MTASLAHWLPLATVPLLECSLGNALCQSATRFPKYRALAWAEGDGLASLD